MEECCIEFCSQHIASAPIPLKRSLRISELPCKWFHVDRCVHELQYAFSNPVRQCHAGLPSCRDLKGLRRNHWKLLHDKDIQIVASNFESCDVIECQGGQTRQEAWC